MRHCSECGSPNHDRRAHRRKVRRRNVDFFADKTGVHPIRDSAGYREWLTHSARGEKEKAELRAKLRSQGIHRRANS